MTQVYSCYDEKGRLLYVGLSENAERRMTQHKYTSDWFEQVTKVDTESYPTREAAMRRERTLVRDQAPIFNRYLLHRDEPVPRQPGIIVKCISLQRHVGERLYQEAHTTGCSMNAIINEALIEYFERRDTEDAAEPKAKVA